MSALSKSTILSKIIELKPHYKKEGIILLGIFGSFARDEANNESDIDILYDIDSEIFCQKYPGFTSFTRLKNIKLELAKIFNRNVDLATIDNDSKTFKKYALKDAIYV